VQVNNPHSLHFDDRMIIMTDMMETMNEKIPTPKELEKEISEFLTKKFGGHVKVATPIVMHKENPAHDMGKAPKKDGKIHFNLKPEELVSYLDQYIIKQEKAKAILATKICTHFNRIRRYQDTDEDLNDLVGGIKSNVLMIGPTGVGKTYMIRLIAKKLGVPFVKGDATKFSETGYVGGDVEDLVRDLVREADGDMERAQYGIIYIDEIDKIASTRNLVGADVSRTGVQRALLKPMEETEVDLKVPHDPISMLQEVERFRRTGKRDQSTVNTRHILFIMSGAFTDLAEIIHKRITRQGIGFGARLAKAEDPWELLTLVKSEDLIAYGFESEFVGRLPVRTVFERLTESDLYAILKNPNNPIILGKKLDFSAYGIDVKFDDDLLRLLAQKAFTENTGARGLVSAVESTLLPFEKSLPSSTVVRFPFTAALAAAPDEALSETIHFRNTRRLEEAFQRIADEERQAIRTYVASNRETISAKFDMSLTPERVDIVAACYSRNIMDISRIVEKIKDYRDQIKSIELYFLKNHDINIVLEESAIDFIIQQIVDGIVEMKDLYRSLSENFEHGLKLVRDKTGRNRFFVTKEALLSPEAFVHNLIKNRPEFV